MPTQAIPPEYVANGPDFPVRAGATDKGLYLQTAAAWGAYQPIRNSEMNNVAVNVSDNAQIAFDNASESFVSASQSASSASAASNSANIALTAANNKGNWTDATGAYPLPGEGFPAFYHAPPGDKPGWWSLVQSVSDITLSEPGSNNSDWRFINNGDQGVLQVLSVSPLSGDIEVSTTPTITGTGFASARPEPRLHRQFQIALSGTNFAAPVIDIAQNTDSYTVVSALDLTTGYESRMRDIQDLGGGQTLIGAWSVPQNWSTGAVIIQTPVVTVEGSPSNVPESPLVGGGAFTVQNGADTHQNTEYKLTPSSNPNNVIWGVTLGDPNKETANIPAGLMSVSTEYVLSIRYIGATYGPSDWGTLTFTTKSSFIPEPQDVRSVVDYIGSGSDLSVNTGLDLTAEDGAVLFKATDFAAEWQLYDTVRGVTKLLVPSRNFAESTDINGVKQFTSTGVIVGNENDINNPGSSYKALSFIKRSNFFDIALLSHTNGVDTVYNANSDNIGFAILKNINIISNWYARYNNLPTGNNIFLDTIDSFLSVGTLIKDFSGSDVSIDASAPSGSYLALIFAVSSSLSSNGLYSGNGSSALRSIAGVGFKPSIMIVTPKDSLNHYETRIFIDDGVAVNRLVLTNTAISVDRSADISFNSDGFDLTTTSVELNSASYDYHYLCIAEDAV